MPGHSDGVGWPRGLLEVPQYAAEDVEKDVHVLTLHSKCGSKAYGGHPAVSHVHT